MEGTLEVLKFLSSPFESDNGDVWILKQSGSAETIINGIVEKCRAKIPLAEYCKNISEENCGPPTPSWSLTITTLDLLLRLRDEVEEAETTQPEEQKSVEVLSLQAQLNVQKCVELVIGFGVLPYLLPNVGVCEKIRKKNRLASELFLRQDHLLIPLIKFNRLAQVIDILLEISSHPSFQVLIIPRHCVDILAGLLQVCKVPIAKPNSTRDSLNQLEYDYVMTLRDRFQVHYRNFFDTAPKSLLVSSLFLIGEKPKFMEVACADAINQIIRSSNGLILIASTLLNEASAADVWTLARNISSLMRNSLSRIKDAEESSRAFSDMCSQSVKMILSVHRNISSLDISDMKSSTSTSTNKQSNSTSTITNEPNDVNVNVNTRQESGKLSASSNSSSSLFVVHKELSRIGLYCCLVLMDINCQKCKLLVWDHLFNPVLQLLGDGQVETKSISKNKNVFVEDPTNESNSNTAHIFTSSTDIEKVIIVSDIAESLLSLVIPLGISIPVMHTLQPVWSLLFGIFSACEKYLGKKIQEQKVAQLAQMLKSKLENIFALLIEVVSYGFSDKLDLNVCDPSGSNSKARVNANKKESNDNETKKKDVINKTVFPKTLCRFCIELLLYENINGEVWKNNFELQTVKTMSNSTLELEMSENSQDCSANTEGESIKIVCVPFLQVAVASGSPSQSPPTSSKSSSSFETDQETATPTANAYDTDNTFELLEEECASLSSILKGERLSHFASELFRELLNYEYGNENVAGELEENPDPENGNGLRKEGEKLPSSSSSSSSSHEIKTLLSSSSSKAEIEIGTRNRNRTPGDISTSNELTQLEIQENTQKKKSLRKFVVLKLLGGLVEDETTVENVVKTEDYKDTLLIVELVMKKLALELKDSTCTGESYEFTQSIIFALGFLGTIVETVSSSSSGTHTPNQDNQGPRDGDGNENGIWDELARFVPHLKLIAKSDNLSLVNSGIAVMAENISISIETRGKAGNGTLRKDKSKTVSKSSPFEKALEDVANPMLPIKGHGLLQLRRLIEEKDPETVKNDTKLLVIFQQELANEDSYVYLMAIQGLASLGLKFHHLIVPELIQEYDFINPVGVGSGSGDNANANGCRRGKMYRSMTLSERIECRMKIGEVLVKIIQRLGDIAPMYRASLTNLFFRVVRDDEPLIKASALSNLGELCHLLKFSLGVVLTEVWYNVESILNCEKEVHVRRGALHLMVLLLKGVEKEFNADYLLTNEELGSHLRDVRRLLSRVQQNEQDVVTKTHAQLALDELGLIAKKILLPNQELKYKIRVIN